MKRNLALFLTSLLGACEFLTGQATRVWSEEVALDDGRVITIDRHVEFEESDSITREAYSSIESRSTLSFRGDLSSIPTWDVPLIPLVLYRDEDTSAWVIVATTRHCDVWRTRGKPSPLYWEFRSNDGAWTETPLSQSSFGRKTNLFMMYERKLRSSFFTLALKAALQSNGDIMRRLLEIQGAGTHNCT